MNDIHNSKLDKWGIFWSVACAIHCMAIPIAAIMAPAIAIYLKHEIIHWVLFVIILPVAFFALWRPRRVHKSNGPFILGSFGLALLLISLFLDSGHGHETTQNESYLTIIGSFFLIAAHIYNLKLHRQCCKQTQSAHSHSGSCNHSHGPEEHHHH